MICKCIPVLIVLRQVIVRAESLRRISQECVDRTLADEAKEKEEVPKLKPKSSKAQLARLRCVLRFLLLQSPLSMPLSA